MLNDKNDAVAKMKKKFGTNVQSGVASLGDEQADGSGASTPDDAGDSAINDKVSGGVKKPGTP